MATATEANFPRYVQQVYGIYTGTAEEVGWTFILNGTHLIGNGIYLIDTSATSFTVPKAEESRKKKMDIIGKLENGIRTS